MVEVESSFLDVLQAFYKAEVGVGNGDAGMAGNCGVGTEKGSGGTSRGSFGFGPNSCS